MGAFALLGMLLIVLDFVLLALGLGLTRGRFEFGDLKIAGPIWFILLMTGIVLIII
jgi:hypothetical protein